VRTAPDRVHLYALHTHICPFAGVLVYALNTHLYTLRVHSQDLISSHAADLEGLPTL